MATLYIGDTEDTMVAIPEPHKMEVDLQDIDSASTTRSADGTMLRDRLCGGESSKRKLILEFAAMRSDKMQTILQAIKNDFFWVSYPDPYTADRRAAVFYAGDRSAPIYSTNLHGRGMLWEGLKVNLIEK